MTGAKRRELRARIDARRRELIADELEARRLDKQAAGLSSEWLACAECGRELDGGRTAGCHLCNDRVHQKRKRERNRTADNAARQARRTRNRAVASATIAGGGSFTPKTPVSSRRAATPSTP